MKTLAIAILGTSSIIASADAGFLGFAATVRASGSNVLVDVFAMVSNASDKLLGIYNANITTTNAGGFYQQPGLNTQGWKPDCTGFTSTRNSIDSFMTIGTYSGGAYGGEFYASCNTNSDPNFPNNCWNSPIVPCPPVPANAGWYTSDPTSVDNSAELLSFSGSGRIDSGPTAASSCPASVGSAGATHGIWVSHLVLANASISSFRIEYSACAIIKDGVTGTTDVRISTFIIPAPGALALLGVAGFASRRRRA